MNRGRPDKTQAWARGQAGAGFAKVAPLRPASAARWDDGGMRRPKHEDRVELVKMRPHQLGWLRRPELDSGAIDVWELPDGRFYAACKGEEPKLATLKVASTD